MNNHKLGFVDTNSGEIENTYKALKATIDSFKFVHVHWRNISKYNTTVFKTSILGIINNAITVKVKYITKV